MASLASQLLTVAVLSLQRQIYHNRGMNRASWNPSYDFIVVGGGTSGSIVAGRLSENPNFTVLLLEAGGPVSLTSDMVPTFYFFDNEWGYYTVPQRRSAFGLRDQRVPVPRGKILGGSHAVNFASYTRGNRRDFDNWAYTHGARGWSYQEILPSYLRSENNTDPTVVAANPMFHSTTGPVEVSTLPDRDPILNRWLQGVSQLGVPLTDFSNLVNQYGSSVLQTTQSKTNWTRQTTASAFLEVNIARPNLHVLVNSHVTRVLFSGNNQQSMMGGAAAPTATGIEFVRNNQTYQVMANREVILSAGSINSPQILMTSGVGHRDHLSSLGISVVADLPVGDNLYEHLAIPFDFWVTNASDITLSRNLNTILTVQNLYQFLKLSQGPLTRMPMTETYIGTGINGDNDWPDVNQYLLINQIGNVDSMLDVYSQSNREEWRSYLTQFENDNRHVWIAYCLFRPRTRGTVRLASANPFVAPLIDPNYFGDQQDLAALVKGMVTGFQYVESPYLAPYFRYSALPNPGCSLCPGRTLSQCPSYLACVAQTYTYTTYHPVGTCKMGNASSTDAVVDERLRVRGVRNLRVIDSSIMPVITNANTNAPSMMIGERGAELVRQDYGLFTG